MTTHHFQPTHYHTTIGSHEPVLHIGDGDTVITTTVDARGRDARVEQATRPGNPQTGPFFVDGAEPGDTLVLQLDSIVPNRTYGWTGRMVAPNIVDPYYVPELPWPSQGDRTPAEWYVDTAAGTARLLKPETKLGELTLPIAPML